MGLILKNIMIFCTLASFLFKVADYISASLFLKSSLDIQSGKNELLKQMKLKHKNYQTLGIPAKNTTAFVEKYIWTYSGKKNGLSNFDILSIICLLATLSSSMIGIYLSLFDTVRVLSFSIIAFSIYIILRILFNSDTIYKKFICLAVDQLDNCTREQHVQKASNNPTLETDFEPDPINVAKTSSKNSKPEKFANMSKNEQAELFSYIIEEFL